MTEREYIDATNLAKVRAARTILRDLLPMTKDEEAWLIEIQRTAYKLEERLTKIVRTEG